MEEQNKKKKIKIIGGSALLLVSLGACSIYALSQQNNQNTQVSVEESTTTSVLVKVEEKSTKETPHTVLKEETVEKLVELSSQAVAEETVNTIIAVAEANLTQPEELDKVVTLIEKPTTDLDKVVGLVEQDDVAVLPTPTKPTEEKPTVPSNENTKPSQPTEDTTTEKPVEPVAPVNPTEPTAPVTPTQPIEPVAPVNPTEPTSPVTPAQPSEELSEDEKRLDIKEKEVDGQTVKYATAEPAVEEVPELDLSKLDVNKTTNELNQ